MKEGTQFKKLWSFCCRLLIRHYCRISSTLPAVILCIIFRFVFMGQSWSCASRTTLLHWNTQFNCSSTRSSHRKQLKSISNKSILVLLLSLFNQVLKNFYFLFKNLPCDKASRENKTKLTEKSSALASVVCNAVQLPGEGDLCQHLSYSQYGALVEHQ